MRLLIPLAYAAAITEGVILAAAGVALITAWARKPKPAADVHIPGQRPRPVIEDADAAYIRALLLGDFPAWEREMRGAGRWAR